jgi:hypothetical protein
MCSRKKMSAKEHSHVVLNSTYKARSECSTALTTGGAKQHSPSRSTCGALTKGEALGCGDQERTTGTRSDPPCPHPWLSAESVASHNPRPVSESAPKMTDQFDPDEYGVTIVNSIMARQQQKRRLDKGRPLGLAAMAEMQRAGVKVRHPLPPDPNGNGVVRLRADLRDGAITVDEVLSLSCRKLGPRYGVSFKEANKWQRQLRATGAV